jgi:thiosulfate reductase cytochrome b subunit
MKGLYLHPLPIRIWHWINAFLILALIVTGLQLRVPDMRIFGDYRYAVALHKYLGFVLAGSFLFWLVAYLIAGGLVRHYALTPAEIKRVPAQAVFYLYGFFRGRPNPFAPSQKGKFNPLQKIAYSSLMFIFMPVIIATGILFSDILYFLPAINAIGGLRILDAIHVVFAYLFVIYLVVHLYMATLGKYWYSHVKAMVTGWEGD